MLGRLGFLPVLAVLASCSQESPKAIDSRNSPAIPIASPVAKEVCDRLNSTINQNIVEAAVSSEGSFDPKTVLQQTARAQIDANRLSVIMINVQLLSQNGCSPRTTPIDPSAYHDNAFACFRARVERSVAVDSADRKEMTSTLENMADACNFSKWSFKGK
jgi:hypothetical protein